MRKLLFASLCFALSATLTGCGVERQSIVPASGEGSDGSTGVTGRVHGGQQGVAGATIQLYSVGTGGNGSAATPKLTQTVTTDAAGFFTLDTTVLGHPRPVYTCSSSSEQVYIVATGGNPGDGGTNANLALMAALGNCGNLTQQTSITINEVTTAAAVWGLSAFMTGYANVGASATNSTGIANAMLDAQLLASYSTGMATVLPTNLNVETGKLYALADVIASCVNTSGGTECNPLFSAAKPAGETAPADTVAAALSIVENPLLNSAAIYQLVGSTPPFPTSLNAAPNDWTMTMAVTGGGVNDPSALGIDASGNVWVADYYGAVSEFSAQGTPLSPSTGYGVGYLNEVYGLAVDASGNIWVTNQQSNPNANGSVSKLLGSASGSAGTIVMNGGYGSFWDGSIDFPDSISADTNGNIFIAEYANGSATLYNSSGQLVAGYLGQADGAFPSAVAADANHGVWIAQVSSNNITHVNSAGTITANVICCDGANGLAVDANGNVWAGSYYNSTFSEVSASGQMLISEQPILGTGYSAYPAGVAIDAGQNVWFANYRGESVGHLSGSTSTTPGTILTPPAGLGYAGPAPATPRLLLPYAVAPDRSGNLWVSNSADDNLIVFFGVAVPTVTPVQPVPTAP